MGSVFKNVVIGYLSFIAFIRLKLLFKGKIVGIAGCYGKSSAVTLTHDLLSKKFSVLSSYARGKGLNSESGIPFAILGINPDQYRPIDWVRYLFQATKNLFAPFQYEILVLEMGVDKPNDMRHLTRYFPPDIGVLLNSNNTHSANFEKLHKSTKKSYESLISYENGYIFERAKEAIFYNLEDPEVVSQIYRFQGRHKIAFSTDANSIITQFSPSLKGTKVSFKYANKTYTLTHPQPLLEEYKNTFALLIKLAEYFKIHTESLLQTLQSFVLPPGRCSLFRGKKGIFIIDSSYNSSLVPATSALLLLDKISPGRKIAILGDMRELGELSESEHKKIALVAAKTTDIVITVGPLMKKHFHHVYKNSMRKSQQIFSFDSTKKALEFIKKNNYSMFEKNDTVLVKGSQNTLFLEIIVEELLSDESDKDKLCRRDFYYAQKRKQIVS